MAKDERDIDERMNGEVPKEEEQLEDEQLTSEGEDDSQEVIEKLIAQRDDYLDQLQRSRAEFINFRKRTETERSRLGEMFTSQTLAQFLPIIDDFDRAMEAIPDDQRESGWVSGLTMIHTKLRGILERAGVSEVEGVGAAFDPSVHEAVATEPGSQGRHVVEVYQKGYRIGDTLLRAAMVKTGDVTTEAEAASDTTNA